MSNFTNHILLRGITTIFYACVNFAWLNLPVLFPDYHYSTQWCVHTLWSRLSWCRPPPCFGLGSRSGLAPQKVAKLDLQCWLVWTGSMCTFPGSQISYHQTSGSVGHRSPSRWRRRVGSSLSRHSSKNTLQNSCTWCQCTEGFQICMCIF